MATYYDDVPGDVPAITDDILGEYYPELTEAGVSIGFLFAKNPKGPAVKLHGYPCAATIKVNSYKDRKEGKTDVTITIDAHEWLDRSHERRRALISHELFHLVLKRDKQGEIKRDDLARPLFKTKLHDIVMGGFSAIAERHGEDSDEVQIARAIQGRHGQLLWDWAEPGDGRMRRRKGSAQAAAVEPGLTVAAAG